MAEFTEQDRELLKYGATLHGFSEADRHMLQETHDRVVEFTVWQLGHEKSHTVDSNAYMKVLESYDKRLDGHSKRIDSIRDRLLIITTGAALLAGLITLLNELGIL